MLLIGAALFIRSYSTLLQMKPGFQRQNVLIVNVDIRRAVFDSGAAVAINRTDAGDSSKSSFRQKAAVATLTPISGSTWNTMVQMDGSRRRNAAMMQCF